MGASWNDHKLVFCGWHGEPLSIPNITYLLLPPATGKREASYSSHKTEMKVLREIAKGGFGRVEEVLVDGKTLARS